MSAPRVPAGANSLAATATRRGLLGAIAIAPVLALQSTPALALQSEWRSAVRDWEQTRATWYGIADRYAAAEAAVQRDPTPENREAEDRLDKLDTEWMHKDDAALRRIVATPAPDIEAVIYKLKLGEEHALGAVDAAIADLRRLTRRAEL